MIEIASFNRFQEKALTQVAATNMEGRKHHPH